MSSSAAVEEEGAAVAMGGEEAVAETKPASSSSKDEDEEMDDHDSDDVDEDSEEDDGDDEDEMDVERREDGRGVATDSSTAEKEEVAVAGDGVEYSEQPPAAICCVVMEPWTSDGTHRICLPNMFQDNVNVESALGPALKAAFMVMDLRNLRSQLYSAAEYFEVFYRNNSHKPTVMVSLKDYTIEALVSTVDHLGFVSYKVDNLVNEKADEVNETEFRVSSIEQGLLEECRAIAYDNLKVVQYEDENAHRT